MPSEIYSLNGMKLFFGNLTNLYCIFLLICYSVLVGNKTNKQNERQKTMAKAIQGENYNFTVEAVPSYHQLPDGQFVRDGFIANRRTDTHQVLGKVSTVYGLIQNGDLISAAEDAFKASGLLDYSRRIIVTGDGEKLYAVYTFKSKIKKLAKVGDELGLQLTLQNSFDGSLRASFIAGLLRLLCLNGMTGIAKQFGLTQKHGSKSVSLS